MFSPLSTTAYGTLSFNTTTGTFTFTVDRGAIDASGAPQTVSFTVTATTPLGTDTDTVFINIALCVLRGTLIETEGGLRPVEDLKPGDRVTTVDSGPQPIRWVGSRLLSAAEFAQKPELRPIRINAGALGAQMPHRDLIVSPQHRILLTGWKAELFFGQPEILVPAKGLVNDQSITIAHDLDRVEYFHVLFDRHEIMITNGAPTESFFPGDYVLDQMGAAIIAELRALFPELVDAPEKFGSSARLSIKPAEAAALRHRILQ